MNEQTVNATVGAHGQLELAQQLNVLPGPVTVTVRTTPEPSRQRGLADVARAIAADLRSRGYSGRSTGEIATEEAAQLEADELRDRDLSSARGSHSAREI